MYTEFLENKRPGTTISSLLSLGVSKKLLSSYESAASHMKAYCAFGWGSQTTTGHNLDFTMRSLVKIFYLNEAALPYEPNMQKHPGLLRALSRVFLKRPPATEGWLGQEL